jgi:hypothetical protein
VGNTGPTGSTGASGDTGSGVCTLANQNTADGNGALNVVDCTPTTNTGGANTAIGWHALFSNTTGEENTVTGSQAFRDNQEGSHNTVAGFAAMIFSSGTGNTANGHYALFNNETGDNNVAIGQGALLNTAIGNNNIALGSSAGTFLNTGDNNIYIGNIGVSTAETNSIHIGTDVAVAEPQEAPLTTTYIAGIKDTTLVTETPFYVVIDPVTGQLGASSVPVPTPTPPGRPALGQIEKDIKAMDAAIAQQRDEFKALVAEQRKSIEILTARVKAQDDQLQRVTVRMEQNRVTPKKVANTK